MKLILYYAPVACSLVPFITLTEAGALFDIVNVNMVKRKNLDPEYIRINPKHKVPVLAIDGDPLTENVAIQIWINKAFPDARLLPSSPDAEIKAISFMAWCASGIHPELTPNAFPNQYCDAPGTEDNVRQLASKKLHASFQIADDMLGKRAWFFDVFTAPDAYFFWCFRLAKSFNIDLSNFKNCIRHFDQMQQRASVQKAMAYEAKTLHEYRNASR
jgi:glutathione S-transferase